MNLWTPTRRWIVVAVVVALAGAAGLVVLPSNAPAEAAEVISSFNDDDWSIHEANINGLGASGVTKGCNPPANDRYCPDRNVTRGQMAAFLVRGFKLPPAPSAGFTDTAGHLFEKDIDRLAAAGITIGCNPPANTLYCPDSNVTRGQMASFLARALELEPVDTGPYRDIAGNVHARTINAISAARVTLGCNEANDRYCPDDRVTRAQMASFLVRAIDGVNPIPNRISLRPGSFCTKDRTRCSASLRIPAGRSFEIREGWYQTLPYQPGEEAKFVAGGTRFNLTRNNSAVALSGRTTNSPTRTTREWSTTIDGLTPGTHTFVGTWRWNGNVNLTVTLVVTAT